MSFAEDGFAEAAKALAEANGISFDTALTAMFEIGDTPMFDETGRVRWTDRQTGITHSLIVPSEDE